MGPGASGPIVFLCLPGFRFQTPADGGNEEAFSFEAHRYILIFRGQEFEGSAADSSRRTPALSSRSQSPVFPGKIFPEPFRGLLGADENFLFPEVFDPAAFHEDPAVDDHRVHIAGQTGVDEGPQGIDHGH